ncbi:MAG: tRNA (adenosine(37)-N6)-threonylcarbamoyltransferase complex ATPase subunit type 1 TsaE [Acidimicrobiales bacterium]
MPETDPSTIPEPIVVATSCPAQTKQVAAELAAQLRDGDLLVLAGDLGAGKTCFTQGLGAGLGIEGRITSPTFTLANQYEGRLELHHLDVYRIDDIGETLDLDLPELLERGVTVIEWGEQIEPVLPADRLTVRLLLGADDDDRELRFEPGSAAWRQRLGALAAIADRLEPC